jgi:hypothetical protein
MSRAHTLNRYANQIRRFRDFGPDPDVQDAYDAGVAGDPCQWSSGTKRRAAYVAGSIHRRRGDTPRQERLV